MPRTNAGPHLTKGPKGVWQIAWTDNGRSRRRSTGTENNGQAQKVLANFLLLNDRTEGEVRSETVLVGDILGDPEAKTGDDYWHEHVLPKVIGRDTQKYAIQKLRAHFGILPVRDVLPKDVESYADKRRLGRLGRPSKDGTIARELSVLNAAVHHAVKAKRVTADQAPTIELPAAGPPKDRWLTHDEADRLLAAALGGRAAKDRLPRVYCFIALALATASRKTALLELKRDQIDLEHGTISLNPAGRSQTKKRRPKVPMSDEIKPVIERILRETKGDFLLGHDGSTRTAFANAVDRAKLENVTPHTLRHTWATWAAQAGVDMWMIAGVLGDSIATTMKTYAHHSPEHLRSAVNAVRRKAA